MPKIPITRVLSARMQGRYKGGNRSKSVSVIVISILVCLSFVVIALIPVVEEVSVSR